MRNYVVPPDINEKEKVIGGVLNINQFFWLLGGFVLGAVVFVVFFPVFGKFSLALGGLFSLTGVPFVVIKPKDLTLFEYLKRKQKFKKKNKKLPNIKKDYSW